MWPKRRAAGPELRAELAEVEELMVAQAAGVDPAAQAGFAKRLAAIRSGKAIRLAGWEVPQEFRAGFGMQNRLILGEDDILRPDPAFHGG